MPEPNSHTPRRPAHRRARGCRFAVVLGTLVLLAACGSRRPMPGPEPSPGPAAPAGPADLRVLVYNIHAGRDAAGADNLRRVADVVGETGPDLVLLQEVDRNTRRSGDVDQLAELVRLTGYHGAFGKTLDYQGGAYGIAVLSRWPIADDTLIRLPVEPPQPRAAGSYEPRGALRARVDAPGGPIGVVNTHLDASAEDGFRRQEVAGVLDAAASFVDAGLPTVVGGDFNAEPGSAPVAALEAGGWTDAWTTCRSAGSTGTSGAATGGVAAGVTYPADAPVKRIDYLFLSPDLRCRTADVPPARPSDHRPLLVTLSRSDARTETPPAAADPGEGAPLPPAFRGWVDSTLATLTLREKAGQLVMPWVGGDYVAVPSPEMDELVEWVEEDRVGGLVISIGTPLAYAAKLNELQRHARVPLLIASDMENGPGMRLGGIYALPSLLPQGAGTTFPPVMALGATGSDSLAFALGRVLGEEARAVGVHMNFGPVLDVNSNPANPVINTRSFGEEPGMVARLGAAYIRGTRSAGLMTTAKHFPGHGDTSADSHLELPAIDADRARMDSVEFVPFRAAVAAGVDAIMTAHIAVRGILGADAPPATLSPYFMTDVLRDEIGFRGLLFTDAMDMGGVADAFGGGDEVLIRALEAGADILLMPNDVTRAIDAVVGAVESGRLTEERIDASVRRILEAKARAGLPAGRHVPLDSVDRVVGTRAHTNVAREVAERSITLARDRDSLVPLTPGARVLVLDYADAADPIANRAFAGALAAAVEAVEGPAAPDEPDADADGPGIALGAVEVVRADERTPAEVWDALRARADSFDVVVAATQVTAREFQTAMAAGGGFPAFIEGLAAGGTPVVVVSFGSPYLLHGFPSVSSYLLAWGPAAVSQEAAARALLGQAPITGRLPISLPPHHRAGEGIRREAVAPGPGGG